MHELAPDPGLGHARLADLAGRDVGKVGVDDGEVGVEASPDATGHAVQAVHSGSARVNGLDSSAGSIAEGLDADFAIVDADLAHLPAAEICQAAVAQTWVRGEVVYQQ